MRPNLPYGTRFDRRQPFGEQTGLVYVRGCEVQGMLDDKGRVIEEGKFYFASAVIFLIYFFNIYFPLDINQNHNYNLKLNIQR